ncbi:hypothetical protein H0H92_012864, partial [Tricholoma furcatifolium]
HRIKAARRFEEEHSASIKDYDFKKGDLVLVRNTQVEKVLSRKMRPRYLGPIVVILRNKGGAYVLCELDGSVFHRPIAAFRVIPYFARKAIALPEGALDVDTEQLRRLEETELFDDEEALDIPQDQEEEMD